MIVRSLCDVLTYKCTPVKSSDISECLITIYVVVMIIWWLSKLKFDLEMIFNRLRFSF